jgi:peptidoglycan/LPS O-acetylase OafA/YrhL
MQGRPVGDGSAIRQMRQFYALDAFRGLAAIGVALFHFRWTHSELAASVLFERLFNLLDFFFVLSGFMLAHAYLSRPLALGNFVWRRLARLYPLHLFALLMFALLQLAKLAAARSGLPTQQPAFEGMNALNFLDALLLLQSTGLLWHEISWNYPAWTVSAEFLSAVIVYALAVRFGRRALEPLCVALVVACLAYLVLFAVPPSDYGIGSLVRTLYALALGCLLHRLHAQFDLIRGPVAGTIAEGLAMAAVWLLISTPSTRPFWYLVTVALAGVIYVFAAEQGLVSKAFRRLQLHRLGTGSYSIYLNHALIGAIFSKAYLTVAPMLGIAGTLSVAVFVPSFLAVLMLYSRLTLRIIERSGRQLILRAQPLVFQALGKLALAPRVAAGQAVRQP